MATSPRTRLGRILPLAGRLVLAGIFLFAAYGKLRPIDSSPWTLASLKVTPASLSLSMMLFATQVDSYQVLPDWGVMLVSHALPWFELGLGVLLLSGLALRWVSLIATGLIAAFFGIIVRTYFAGLQINCGCFGPGAEPLTAWTILRDGLFLALAAGVTIGAFLRARGAASRRTAPASP
ncbi:MAG TPA: MauE/DoxX family redox-associated membrane protein [Patescibacteria group bacterium]|nr:MauE/DoxX family redox-associated membrane protein [Patescibacteria group bacterium]